MDTRGYVVEQTDEFRDWLQALRDRKARARIAIRLRQAGAGNLGDVASVGDGVHEMRIHFGPGYRVYFKQTGRHIILLLIGGDKGSQSRDIKRAKELAEAY